MHSGCQKKNELHVMDSQKQNIKLLQDEAVSMSHNSNYPSSDMKKAQLRKYFFVHIDNFSNMGLSDHDQHG